MKDVEVIKARNTLSPRARTNFEKRLRVAAYCRVSTDTEDQLNSYKSQVEYYTELIKSKPEWSLAGIYADEAITGTQVKKREDFQRLINDCMNGDVDMVITKSISRFARNTLDTLKYVRMLKDKGVAVFFEEENINTLTMDGELLLVILSSVAQQEVENISANVKKGLKMKMQRGELVGFQGCLGYDYNPEDKTLTVNEEEAAVVRYIFQRYTEGAGGSVIAKELENLGYKTKRGSPKWADSTVIGIIKNEKYKGDILLGKTFTVDPISKRRLYNFGEEDQFYIREHHEPIISEEVFEAAQEILRRRAKPRSLNVDGKREKFSRKYAFSCMIECGFCGGTLTRRSWHSSSQYNKAIWQCVVSTKKGKKFCPESKGVDERTIERAFVESYRLLCQNNKDVLDEFMKRTEEALSESNAGKRLAKAEKDIHALEVKKNKLVDMRLEDTIDKETYDRKYLDLSSQIEQLQKECESLQDAAETESTMRKRVATFRQTLEQNEVLDTFDRHIFESIVEKVIVGGYDSNGNKDPYMIVFVYKTGFKNSVDGKNFKPLRKNSKENHSPAVLCSHASNEAESMCSDSSDDTVRDGEKDIEIIKAKGRLKVLLEKTNAGESVPGMCGIGHTRWATHGEPSEVNAHPHVSDNGNVAAVHNGIIENYQELKEKLLRRGYSFYSSTDTEVAVKLVDYYYQKYGGSPVEAVRHAMVRIRGSYALAMMFRDYPEEIFVARKDSPMILGVENGESYIASDVPAILKYTRNVYYIGNLELACVKPGEITFYNLDGEEIEKEPKIIEWDAEAAEKAGFEHFMMKEIHEQPKAVADTLNSVIREGKLDLTEIGLDDERIRSISQVYIVACGSAYHVGMAAQYVIEDLAGLPVRVELASEFRYRKPLLDPDGLAVIISQSGETADSLAALRECKEKGIRTMAIVNVVGSSIAREADHVFYTLAGPEISVATTKAYSTQLIASYVLALQMALVRGKISEEQCESYIKELKTLPDKIGRIIEDKERLQWFASKQANAKDIFFIGRGIDYAISLEGSLKMKEISYIHSEAYAAGELKHGTISLIEDGTLVIGVLTQPELYEKTVSNMVECRSRGAYLMGLTTFGNYNIEDTADFTVYIPKTDPHFATSLAVIPLQLLGYYVSVNKGLDVDKPRNLAKSVTVE